MNGRSRFSNAATEYGKNKHVFAVWPDWPPCHIYHINISARKKACLASYAMPGLIQSSIPKRKVSFLGLFYNQMKRNGSWCYSEEVKSGEMIACDNLYTQSNGSTKSA